MRMPCLPARGLLHTPRLLTPVPAAACTGRPSHPQPAQHHGQDGHDARHLLTDFRGVDRRLHAVAAERAVPGVQAHRGEAFPMGWPAVRAAPACVRVCVRVHCVCPAARHLVQAAHRLSTCCLLRCCLLRCCLPCAMLHTPRPQIKDGSWYTNSDKTKRTRVTQVRCQWLCALREPFRACLPLTPWLAADRHTPAACLRSTTPSSRPARAGAGSASSRASSTSWSCWASRSRRSSRPRPTSTPSTTTWTSGARAPPAAAAAGCACGGWRRCCARCCCARRAWRCTRAPDRLTA